MIGQYKNISGHSSVEINIFDEISCNRNTQAINITSEVTCAIRVFSVREKFNFSGDLEIRNSITIQNSTEQKPQQFRFTIIVEIIK